MFVSQTVQGAPSQKGFRTCVANGPDSDTDWKTWQTVQAMAWWWVWHCLGYLDKWAVFLAFHFDFVDTLIIIYYVWWFIWQINGGPFGWFWNQRGKKTLLSTNWSCFHQTKHIQTNGSKTTPPAWLHVPPWARCPAVPGVVLLRGFPGVIQQRCANKNIFWVLYKLYTYVSYSGSWLYTLGSP